MLRMIMLVCCMAVSSLRGAASSIAVGDTISIVDYMNVIEKVFPVQPTLDQFCTRYKIPQFFKKESNEKKIAHYIRHFKNQIQKNQNIDGFMQPLRFVRLH